MAEAKKNQNQLIAVIKSGQKEKADACRELQVLGTRDAVPALAALLADEKMNHMARYALESIPDPAVEDVLRDALGKLKGRPLVGVIGSLGVRRDEKAVDALVKLLDDADPDVVSTTARSLGRIATPEAANALCAKVGSAPAAVRSAVADGALNCAEVFLAQGKKAEAAPLYAAVAKADVLTYIKEAAQRGAAQAK